MLCRKIRADGAKNRVKQAQIGTGGGLISEDPAEQFYPYENHERGREGRLGEINLGRAGCTCGCVRRRWSGLLLVLSFELGRGGGAGKLLVPPGSHRRWRRRAGARCCSTSVYGRGLDGEDEASKGICVAQRRPQSPAARSRGGEETGGGERQRRLRERERRRLLDWGGLG
jgi:hypothetical protein